MENSSIENIAHDMKIFNDYLSQIKEKIIDLIELNKKNLLEEYKKIKKKIKKSIKSLKELSEIDDYKKILFLENQYKLYSKCQEFYNLISFEKKEKSNEKKAEKNFKKKLKLEEKLNLKSNKNEFFNLILDNNSSEIFYKKDIDEVEILFLKIDNEMMKMKYKFTEEMEFSNDNLFIEIRNKIKNISPILCPLKDKQKLFDSLDEKIQNYRQVYLFNKKNNSYIKEFFLEMNNIFNKFDDDFSPEEIKKLKDLSDEIFYSSIRIDDLLKDNKILDLIEEESIHISLLFDNQIRKNKDNKNKELIQREKNFVKNLHNLELIKTILVRFVQLKKKFIMQFYIDNKNFEFIFKNHCVTKNKFNERKKTLLFFFHPDKIRTISFSDEEKEDAKSLSNEFFSLLNNYIEYKKKDLKLEIDFEKANAYFEEAQLYYSIKKRKLNNNELGDTNFTIPELEKIIKDKSEISYEVYQGYLDFYLENNSKDENRYKIIELLNKMTKCLIVQGEETLARIYILFAIRENTHPFEEITELKNESYSIEMILKNLQEKYKIKDENTLEKSNKYDQMTQALQIISTESLVKKEIDNQIKSYFFRDHFEVLNDCYDEFKMNRFDDKKRANNNKKIAIGSGAGFAGGLGVVFFIPPLGFLICSCVMIGAIFGIVGSEISLSNKVEEIKKITDQIKTILTNSSKFYQEGKDQEFIDEISKKFNGKEKLFDNETVIKNKEFDFKKFSQTLLNWYIKPQSISCFLNCIADVFLRQKIELDNLNTYDEGKRILQWLIDEKNILFKECHRLDDEIDKLKDPNKSDFNIFERLENQNSEKYVNNNKSFSYINSLRESIMISKINLVISNILGNNNKQAALLIREIIIEYDRIISLYPRKKKMMDTIKLFYKLYLKSPLYLDQPKQPEEETKSNQSLFKKENSFENVKDLDLLILEKQLEDANNESEKSLYYGKIGFYYETKFDNEPSQLVRTSIKYLKDAEDNYQKSLNYENLNLSLFGKARVLMKMNRFKEASSFLEEKKDFLKNFDEFHLYNLRCCRKFGNYEGFEITINDYKKSKAQISNKEICGLIQRENESFINLKNRMANSKNIEYKEYNLDLKRTNEKNIYTCASFNGGGVRGLMEAILASEVERDTGKPISCLFNNLSGTSTGGLIAAALSLPDLLDNTKPQFRSSEVVDIYENESAQIFGQRNFFHYFLYGPKYQDEPRLNLLKKYFGERKINESLTDLIITAVSNRNPESTFLFTKREASSSNEKNFKYYDALMATSAAPTFFKAYQISNVGSFFDGGVQANNPSDIIYREYHSYYKKDFEKIFILNFGSGYSLSDCLNPSNSNQGALYWAKNLVNVTLPAQEIKVNENMYSVLKEFYQSWQIAIPSHKDILLDSCEKNDIQYMKYLAYEFIEDLKFNESNHYNKTIEFLLNNKMEFII